MNVIQKDIVDFLKADSTIQNLLAGSDAADVREDQYQGRTFGYPAVRVDVLPQSPRNTHDQTDLSTLSFTIRCYTEGPSSKNADYLGGAINDALHRQQLYGTGYSIPRVRSAGLTGAVRISENLWMAMATFIGNIYPSELVPTELDITLWGDISDIATLFQDSAKTNPVTTSLQAIGALEDKSGNGYDSIQGEEGAWAPRYVSPIQNGLSGGLWDGIDDILNPPTTLANLFQGGDVPISIFVAFRQSSNTGVQTLFNFGGPASVSLLVLDINGTTGYRFLRRDDAGTLKQISAGTPDLSSHLLSIEFTGQVGTLRLDGKVIGSSDTDLDVGVLALNQAGLGARFAENVRSNFFNGDIFEIHVYARVFLAGDRKNIEAYFNDKWVLYI